ncbi:oligomeric Golgi complex component [Tieghemostelium lacteum]|uniref:Conserved oligomeric Golgi complex subunit 1 n=1 Tax=Tieghemostelium lacteum TaxID=361077 RepID=A0A151Z2Q0_TIELA|nr:oligomeric Golgi complex component [Tieghemostelium lacteum]|eukprot:KYQ88233.1 oligomeric Golgi complex component [Tieghemostelium lacteum]
MKSSHTTSELHEKSSSISSPVNSPVRMNQSLSAVVSPIQNTQYQRQSSNQSLLGYKSSSTSNSYGSNLNLLPLLSTSSSSVTQLNLQQQQLNTLIPQYLITKYEAEVNQLFQKNTPEQMKSIEYSKRSEVEDMKNQLKNLIGNKYRDLVEGSDAIVKMEKSTELINQKVLDMQRQLKTFSEKRNTRKSTNPQDDEKSKKNIITRFSKNCKHLVDIPELMWRCLDNNEYFEVSIQYLTAESLYNNITNQDKYDYIKVLVWLIIKEFPKKSLVNSQEYLNTLNNSNSNSSNSISIDKLLGSLSTQILFDKKSIKEIFNQFLQYRKSQLFSALLHKQSYQNSTAIKNIIHRLLEYLKVSVYLVLKPIHMEITLPKRIIKCYFKITNSNNSNTQQYQYLEDSILEFDNLNPKYISSKTSEWLDQVLNEFKLKSIDILSSINTAKDLSNLKFEIFQELLQFSSPINSNNNLLNQIPLVTGKESTETVSWNLLFLITTNGRDSRYFYEFFDDVLLLKSQSIIESSFSKISLTKIMNECQGHSSSQFDKNFSDYLWQYHEDPIQSIRFKAKGITPLTQSFLKQVNQLYQNSILDFIYLFPNNTNSDSNNTNNFEYQLEQSIKKHQSPSSSSQYYYLSKLKSSPSGGLNQPKQKSIQDRHAQKELELKECIKKAFNKSFRDFSENNQLKIDNILLDVINKTVSTQEILFIAKISKIVYKNQDIYFSNQQESSSTIEQPNISEEILDHLKQQFYYGSIVWIEELVLNSTNQLSKQLDSENWSDKKIEKTWERVSIEIETESGKKESSIYLPYQPSAYILSYLLSISLELSKVSFNTLDKNISRYLLESISTHCYQILSEKLQSTSLFQHKDNYLQLLIDFKYLLFILYGKKPQNQYEIKDQIFKKSLQHYQSIIQQRDQQQQPPKNINYSNEIVHLIKSKMDPIDYQFYEKHINRFIEVTYVKSNIFFGNFTQIHKSIVKADLKKNQGTNGTNGTPTTTDQINTMNLLKSKVNFQLFPLDNISFSQENSTPSSPTLISVNHINIPPKNNTLLSSSVSLLPSDFQSFLKISPTSQSTPITPPNSSRSQNLSIPNSSVTSPTGGSLSSSPSSSGTGSSFMNMSKRISDVFASKSTK